MLVPNCSTFKSFGGLGSNASRFTLASQSVNLLGSGAISEEKWAQPNSLSHLVPTYHMGPNLVMAIFDEVISFNQFWPGAHVGECIAQIWQVRHKLPDDIRHVQESFVALLNVVATEDFPLLPKMQKNFEQAQHAEVIFGRNEPVLTDRHHYWANAFN